MYPLCCEIPQRLHSNEIGRDVIHTSSYYTLHGYTPVTQLALPAGVFILNQVKRPPIRHRAHWRSHLDRSGGDYQAHPSTIKSIMKGHQGVLGVMPCQWKWLKMNGHPSVVQPGHCFHDCSLWYKFSSTANQQAPAWFFNRLRLRKVQACPDNSLQAEKLSQFHAEE